MDSQNKEDLKCENVDFDTLLQEVINDSSKVSELTEEQVIELRKKISPYGRTIDGEKNYACMSIVNVSQEYMKKYLTTSLIGFLFRGCDEYKVFDNEPVIHFDDMDDSDRKQLLEIMYRDAVPARQELAKIMAMDSQIRKDEIAEYEEKNKELIKLEVAERNVSVATYKSTKVKPVNFDDYVPWHVRAVDKNAADLREQQMRTLERMILRAENMTKKVVIREFLDSLFTFNPDTHVRGSYGENPLDPERTPLKTTTAKKSNRSWKKKDKFDMRKEKKNAQPVEVEENKSHVDNTNEFGENDSKTRKSLTSHIPPADTYLKLQMYIDDHFEEIRTAVKDIYHEKPDIEFAVNPYQFFSNEEDAKKFVHKHSDEVLWDIDTLYTNHWNLMGSFKKNRERTDFLNNNTEVITEYLDQLEKDKKLGRQLMMKKAQRKKLENVGLEGPDSKQFRRYKSEFATTAEAMGAVDLSEYKQQQCAYEKYQKNKQIERERLANAKRAPNGAIIADTTSLSVRSGIDLEKKHEMEYPDAGLSEACPEDAVQVDVINMTQGGLNVQRSNFFTDAVAPPAIGDQVQHPSDK